MKYFIVFVLGIYLGFKIQEELVSLPVLKDKPPKARVVVSERRDQDVVSPLYHYHVELVRVIDGDTVILDIDLGFGTWLRNQRIRLAYLNAPELSTPEGKQIKAWLEARLENRSITLETIPNRMGEAQKEKYGRWLGVLHADGQINQELLSLNGVIAL